MSPCSRSRTPQPPPVDVTARHPPRSDPKSRYLIERHTLMFAPSIAVVGELHDRAQNRPRSADGITVVVNPEPMPEPGLTPLRWTEQNIGSITRHFPPEQTEVHARSAATRDALLAMQPSRVLYLATHARAHDESVERALASYVALAPTPGHDGLLRASDVHRLHLPAEIVILGACETGGGRATGDGLIGLSRSFLAAGPSCLVLTITEVLERSSLEVVHRIHEEWLERGHALPAAVRRVQAELAREFPDQPHLWCTFLVHGTLM
ncbi:MAG: CHAT domain-containing protein [Actinomycetota bacterium]|nr:CHAT domain-containing protein [Actinomycetota bacterium]